jgi:hypothetical protein
MAKFLASDLVVMSLLYFLCPRLGMKEALATNNSYTLTHINYN